VNNYHHKPIKRFHLDGVIHDDSVIGRLKTEYIRLLTTEMKNLGYALRIDIDPDFTIMYNESKEIFEFELSLYGIYVGKKKSKWIIGIDAQRVYTQESKLNEFLQEQESRLNQK